MTIPKKKGNRKNAAPLPASLPAIRPLVAGLDVGSSQHWVCGPARDDGTPNVRVFGTTTDQLNELADWLSEQGVESVAMESTSVYWIPIYELLESRGIEGLLVNARQLHNVPGRKTDFSDCQWLQLLHSCGLLRGSFRPVEAITRLRALQRQLANLVAERTRCVQWMQKALDQMNVQVHRAVTDLTGATGMAIVRAIVCGERDPARLAMHRDRRCRKSAEEIARYLTGNWREEHLFNLASALRLFDALETEIAAYDAQLLKEIAALQPPERQEEPVPAHPNPAKEKAIKGTPISGGKPLKNRRNALGANRISGVLRMAALSLERSKTALGASFRRVARHKGGAVAVFATARQLAQLIYRMLRYGHDYVDIGEKAYDQRFQVRRLAALTETAKSLGYTLVPNIAAG